MNHWMPVAHPKDLAARHLLACVVIEVSLISDGGIHHTKPDSNKFQVEMIDPEMTLEAYLGILVLVINDFGRLWRLYQKNV